MKIPNKFKEYPFYLIYMPFLAFVILSATFFSVLANNGYSTDRVNTIGMFGRPILLVLAIFLGLSTSHIANKKVAKKIEKGKTVSDEGKVLRKTGYFILGLIPGLISILYFQTHVTDQISRIENRGSG